MIGITNGLGTIYTADAGDTAILLPLEVIELPGVEVIEI